MGFFQDLHDIATGKKDSIVSRLSGAKTIRGLVSGEETIKSAFSKDLNWFIGENSMFGLSDEQKAARDAELKSQEEYAAQQQSYFDEIKGLYKQGFESTGLTYQQGLSNQGLYTQNVNGLKAPSNAISETGFNPGYYKTGLNRNNSKYDFYKGGGF